MTDPIAPNDIPSTTITPATRPNAIEVRSAKRMSRVRRLLQIAGAGLLGSAALASGAWTTGSAYAAGVPNALSVSSPVTNYGQTITFSDKIAKSRPGAPMPTGAVAFYGADTVGGVIVEEGAFGAGPLNATGRVKFSINDLPAGNWEVWAEYYGDANTAASDSADVRDHHQPGHADRLDLRDQHRAAGRGVHRRG